MRGVGTARVKRLLVIGGAGSRFVAPGVQLVDTQAFTDTRMTSAAAHMDASAERERHFWPAVWALGVGSFAIGTGEFAIMGGFAHGLRLRPERQSRGLRAISR